LRERLGGDRGRFLRCALHFRLGWFGAADGRSRFLKRALYLSLGWFRLARGRGGFLRRRLRLNLGRFGATDGGRSRLFLVGLFLALRRRGVLGRRSRFLALG
jgi:hypothetical protein